MCGRKVTGGDSRPSELQAYANHTPAKEIYAEFYPTDPSLILFPTVVGMDLVGLQRMGATSTSKISQDLQYWRLLSSLFINAGRCQHSFLGHVRIWFGELTHLSQMRRKDATECASVLCDNTDDSFCMEDSKDESRKLLIRCSARRLTHCRAAVKCAVPSLLLPQA